MERILKILLADDDSDDRQVFAEVVKNVAPQATLTLANDGSQLIRSLSSMDTLPDMIFLDLNMPRMNGIECLVALKKDKKYNKIPVAIYSTSSLQKHIDTSYMRGASLYITKPSTMDEIKKQLKKVFTLNLEDYLPQPPREKFVI